MDTARRNQARRTLKGDPGPCARGGDLVLSDLHFHPCLPHGHLGARRRAEEILLLYAGLGIRILAVTEHVYKRPLRNASILQDAWENIDRGKFPTPFLVPGVEANTRENVDLIFLFPDLESLRRSRALKHQDFSYRDAATIRDDEGAVLIIPHPFGPGRTGLGKAAGRAAFLKTAETADYVETHNGSALALLQMTETLKSRPVIGPRLRRLLPKTHRHIEETHCLPPGMVPSGVGTSVSTDIHFPGIPQLVGACREPAPASSAEAFELLRRRVPFHEFRLFEELVNIRLNEIFRISVFALYESLRKETASAGKRRGVLV